MLFDLKKGRLRSLITICAMFLVAAAVPAAETPEQPAPAQEAAQQPPAEPEWKPKTELEHLSVELMNWFDEMMGV